MKLIDKDALMAEIDKCHKESQKRTEIVDADYWNGKTDAYRNVLTFLDTLEVKEVNLEKEFDDYIAKQNAFTNNDNSEIKYYNGDSFNHVYDIYPIAKHFFELGLKAQKGE